MKRERANYPYVCRGGSLPRAQIQEGLAGLGFLLLQVLVVLLFTTLIQLGPDNWGPLP